MSRLWMEESDGERWLINPALVVANPRKKRRGKKMAKRRARRNRMPAGLARYWAKHRRNTGGRRRRRVLKNRVHRRRARRNYASAGMVAMNPRRRHHRRNRVRSRRRSFMRNPRYHRRHYRRNPSLMGFTLPPIMDIAAVSAGMIVPPMMANYIFNNWVAQYSTSKWAYLGTEAVSVGLLGWGAKRFLGPRAGTLVLLSGAARVALDLIQIMAPTLLPSAAMPTTLTGQPFLGFYEKRPGPARNLGRYYSPGASMAAGGGRMIQQVPDRLDPTARF